jgi:hypothetical protein
MTIERWDPFGEMLSLRDAMNRLFEESFVQPGDYPDVGSHGAADRPARDRGSVCA